jgi:hypothetical protein
MVRPTYRLKTPQNANSTSLACGFNFVEKIKIRTYVETSDFDACFEKVGLVRLGHTTAMEAKNES